MANSYIEVPGTNEKLQTYENSIGGNDVHSEAVTLTDSSGLELKGLKTAASSVPVVIASDQVGTICPTGTVALPNLSFVQTFATDYTTAYVEIAAYTTLEVSYEVETNQADTAELFLTNAVDPNVTPPGSNDIERILSTTVAGSGLGGITPWML